MNDKQKAVSAALENTRHFFTNLDQVNGFLARLAAKGYVIQPKDQQGDARDVEPLSVCQEADKIINGVRREDYGPVRESFKVVADGWALIRQGDLSPEEEVAACMIWLKVARSLTGAPHRDSQVDIAGYAGLWSQLRGEL